jgi:nucleoside-diphosphate-sugar epimerase
MKVLVTGATGFLGSHLVRALVARGDRVVVLKRGRSDLTRIRDLLARVALYDTDAGGVEKLLGDHDDLAGVIHTATCYGRDGEPDDVVFAANTAFPLGLLQKAARAKVPLFVHTDTCFNTGPLRYTYLKSYSLSKRQFTEWGEHFASRGDICFANVKLQHPYGPGDAPTKFVPAILRQCLDNVAEIRLTAGEQKKDFIYVEDVVSALLAVLDRAAARCTPFQEYECGTGEAISIRQFVETAHALVGSRSQLNFGALPYRDNEIMYSCADTSALAGLGWSPRFDLEEGLERTLRGDGAFCSPLFAKTDGPAIALRPSRERART